MSRDVKLSFFKATVESVFLHGGETWTLTPTLVTKSLNGCYTRMLRVALNVFWQSHTSNEYLYEDLPRGGDKVAARRTETCWALSKTSLPPSTLVLWEPTHGHSGRGPPKSTLVDILKRDSDVDSSQELEALMHDQRVWNNLVKVLL